ncbi:cupin domain-containing protein [Allobranchiibius sp. CTAmp26]|uniref:cupin domain-containing protein n=1 Tax=Allobranchiibius sp. CTAmp26 TaxID=2815214 RepID=UPI001AA11A5A|nr:cupin domain-containing protein [Allobranchiibius sp. CTAmp26]MBO1756658.1 cupin domain-containing protein [Allobranchiibius sp. CTAmp26]
MSQLYLAQPADQQQLEWLDNGTLAILLDGAATDGQFMMGRFAVARGEAPPYHKHLHEDEIFMLIKGTALVWYDDHQYELQEGGVVFLPRNVPQGYRITSERADLLMINTPAGIEGMFRATGRDKSQPRPEGFEVRPDPDAAERYGNVVLGPPR